MINKALYDIAFPPSSSLSSTSSPTTLAFCSLCFSHTGATEFSCSLLFLGHSRYISTTGHLYLCFLCLEGPTPRGLHGWLLDFICLPTYHLSVLCLTTVYKTVTLPASLACLSSCFIYLFIFWLRWVFIAACRLSLVAASGGYSSLWCAGFSLQWLLLLRSTGSRRAGFSSCGTWA